VRSAALGVFYSRGYFGSSMREIAAAANLSVASIYLHFETKEAILVAILDDIIDEVIADLEKAIADAGHSPVDQLRAAVRVYVMFHVTRQSECFVANTELRSLTKSNRARYVAKRDALQRLFSGIVETGKTDGVFQVDDPREATRAIIAMCRAIAEWYNVSGPLSPGEIAERYVDLSARLLASTSSPPAV
jgi:AcrR family transcriptional regulator